VRVPGIPSPCKGEDGEGPYSARDSFRARLKVLFCLTDCERGGNPCAMRHADEEFICAARMTRCNQLLTRSFAITLLTFYLLGGIVAASSSNSPKDTIYLNDDSDWWSPVSREGANIANQQNSLRVRSKKPAVRGDLGKFSILGVKLTSHQGDDWLRDIETILGKASIVQRGEGATGRSQLCYRSATDSGNVKLIFEHNEIFYSFYLFEDGDEWNGIEYCAPSPNITAASTTWNGLKLGMSEAQTESILGPTTYTKGGKREYRFATDRIVTPIHDEPEDWFISGEVQLEFSNHQLTYISVSRSEVW
jgi:hypothetical protein